MPDLTSGQRDFLRVLRAVAAGHEPSAPPADWAAVLDLAALHEVGGFLYPRVAAWPSARQPPALLLAAWRRSFLAAAAQYTRVAMQARELLAALRDAGVRAIPLKGLWLAERVYEDGACRPMNDLDLLVTIQDLGRARAVVERLEYATPDAVEIGGRSKHLRYRKSGMPLPLELHWGLRHEASASGGQTEPDRVWTGLHDEMLHGVPVPAFPPERQMVYLAQHILQHTLTVPLRAYLDLALLARHAVPPADPGRLEDEARAWRTAFGVKFILGVAADLVGVSLPDPLARFVRSAGACDDARRAAVAAAVQLNGESKRITPALEASLRASRFPRLAIGLKRVFLPPVEIRRLYPGPVRRWSMAGGYIGRFADLVRRYGGILRNPDRGGGVRDSDRANFITRQTLRAWILAQDRGVSPASGQVGAEDNGMDRPV